MTQNILVNNSGIIFKLFFKLFFKKVTLDRVSKDALAQQTGKGKIIFGSFQTTNTSLLILNQVLKSEDFRYPQFSLGFPIYLHKYIYLFIKDLIIRIARIFSQNQKPPVDNEQLLSLLKKSDPVAVSLSSKSTFIKRYIKKEPDPLSHLITIQMEQDDPIIIFPQIMFWNMNPQRSKMLFVSKATGDKGFLSAIITILKSRTLPFIHLCTPVNIREEIENAPGSDINEIAAIIRKKIFSLYNSEVRTVLGPVIKSKQEMAESVLYHENTMQAIKEEIEEKHKSERKIRKNAYNCFSEIAADFSMVWIHYFQAFLFRFFFNKIFNGIDYTIEDIKKIREASKKGPLIIVPSHRSHMDYLLISSIFYKEKIVPPHIIAGANLAFFPVGKIFRKCGAIFIRRSFKGLNLYTTILKQYLKTMLQEGYSIEFFIEGGRTRTGKVLPPKKGILKYLVEAVDEGYSNDLVFLPIAINYNRILEESSYHKELRGSIKKKESTSNFVKSRKLLKRKYGKVNLSFADPIQLQEMKKTFNTEDVPLDKICNTIIEQINKNVMVTPFALITTALLLSPSEGISLSVLKSHITLLFDYLHHLQCTFDSSFSGHEHLEPQLEYVLNSYQQDSIISRLIVRDQDNREPVPLEKYLLLNEEERIRISFYKNTLVHFLFPISFTAISLLLKETDSINLQDVDTTYSFLFEMISHEIIYSVTTDAPVKTCHRAVSYLETTGAVTYDRASSVITGLRNEILYPFAAIMLDFLESYTILLDFISSCDESKLERPAVINRTRKFGIKNYHMGIIKYQEAISVSNFHTGIDYLLLKKLVTEKQSSSKKTMLVIPDKIAVKNLLTEIRSIIKTVSNKNQLDSSSLENKKI